MPKAYFGYEPAEARCRYEPTVVVDRLKAYAFLKELLQLAYYWAHVQRDFLQLRLGGQEDQTWADSWIERIANLYELNHQRLRSVFHLMNPRHLPNMPSMNWSQLLSDHRIGREDQIPSKPHRLPWQTDYDRIIFSSAFRRLRLEFPNWHKDVGTNGEESCVRLDYALEL